VPGGPNTAQSLGDDGWRRTDSRRGRLLCTVGLGQCDVIMNVGKTGKLTQAHMALHLTVAYLLHVLPYVGLVRMFTRHCRSVISRWLVTTVTLLVAVRHQFMWPVVGVCCLCSGQQYSPPSPLQPALSSPPPPRIPFTAVDGCSEWNAGRRRTGASQRRRQSVALAGFGDRFLGNETGHRFEKRVPVTGYRFTTLIQTSSWTSAISVPRSEKTHP